MTVVSNEMRKVRDVIDAMREVLGYDPLYEEMDAEEYKEARREKARLNAKPYSAFTEEEKEKHRQYVRAWRKKQKEAALNQSA